MIRKIISIDEEKCNGCGLCVDACHEGALVMENGKARLISDTYCDGLGDCLPECPTGAINIIEREAAEYDEEAVNKRIAQKSSQSQCNCSSAPAAYENHTNPAVQHMGCPGSRAHTIKRQPTPDTHTEAVNNKADASTARAESHLGQWPCQIKLVHPSAPYFNNAHLLIAADCTAFAYANIHQDFMKNKVTIIGCPKLDDVDYSEKLALILANNEIKSLTVLRMEVPCCGGIVHAVKNAMINSEKMVPWNVVTISTDGNIIES
jgi:NAD-dependent dihydropyrimidine dehydrogenase PreA subunit